ncbi:MAG TPA: hypothetical protein VGR37_14370 [Longimicrobiaceae bacterium]|nr:hypothetical protein [Longimicrobiaceae bacterium]
MANFRLRAGFGVLLAGILITIGGCSEPSAVVDAGSEAGHRYQFVEGQQPVGGASYTVVGTPRVEQVIGPEGGTLQIPGGHTLAFPAGALSKPTRIQAKADARYVGVELEPHGLQFPAGNGPVLTLSMQAAQMNQFASFSILYVSPSGTILEVLSADADRVRNTLTTRLSHFSGYLAGGHRS